MAYGNYGNGSMSPLIFIHIPKTAGTSFRLGLKRRLGENAVLSDYGPIADETSTEIREILYTSGKTGDPGGVERLLTQGRALCGHFHSSKYPFIHKYHVVTFVRDPFQRALSEFHHNVRHNGYRGDMESFLLEKGRSNQQSRMLSGVLDRALIGVTEFYELSLCMIFRKTGIFVPPLRENVNTERGNGNYGGADLAKGALNEFRGVNDMDYQLVARARERLKAEFRSSLKPREMLDLLFLCIKHRSAGMRKLYIEYLLHGISRKRGKAEKPQMNTDELR